MLAFGVFAEDVYLDVEGGAGREGVEAGGGVGVGDDGYLDHVVHDGGYGEADAFDGDGALGNYVSGKRVGELDAETPVGIGLVGRDGGEGDEGRGSVDVALNDVASQRRACWCRELKVDDSVGAQVREGGAGDGLGGKVGGEAWGKGVGLDAESRQADAVDCDAIAGVEARGERGRGDGDAGRARGWSDG